MAKWLAKTEPGECSIDDFANAPDKPVVWEGVRNYQARNFLSQMAEGDQVLIYHSSYKDIGGVGIVKVVRTAYPDPSQFNKNSGYFDHKSPKDNPRWDAVDLVFVKKLPRLISLDELKSLPELSDLALVKKGSRLSVMPVSEDEWKTIVSLT